MRKMNKSKILACTIAAALVVSASGVAMSSLNTQGGMLSVSAASETEATGDILIFVDGMIYDLGYVVDGKLTLQMPDIPSGVTLADDEIGYWRVAIGKDGVWVGSANPGEVATFDVGKYYSEYTNLDIYFSVGKTTPKINYRDVYLFVPEDDVDPDDLMPVDYIEVSYEHAFNPVTLKYEMTKGWTVPEDSIPTKDGYVFVGWNTEADLSGKTYAPDEAIMEYIECLYAVFQDPNKPTTTTTTVSTTTSTKADDTTATTSTNLAKKPLAVKGKKEVVKSVIISSVAVVVDNNGGEVALNDVFIVVEDADGQIKADALAAVKTDENNCVVYDIYMTDSEGNLLTLKSGLVEFILVYPSNSSYNYSLYHYTGEKAETVDVKKEKEGLQFSASSFSPYVLVWSEGSSNPATGDDFNAFPFALAAFGSLSLAAGIIFGNKKRKISE